MEKLTGLVINEDAYLNKEEEAILLKKVSAFNSNNKMCPEEKEKFWAKIPTLRMFANSFYLTYGAEEYYKSENENIELIKNKTWEEYEELKF